MQNTQSKIYIRYNIWKIELFRFLTTLIFMRSIGGFPDNRECFVWEKRKKQNEIESRVIDVFLVEFSVLSEINPSFVDEANIRIIFYEIKRLKNVVPNGISERSWLNDMKVTSRWLNIVVLRSKYREVKRSALTRQNAAIRSWVICNQVNVNLPFHLPFSLWSRVSITVSFFTRRTIRSALSINS